MRSTPPHARARQLGQIAVGAVEKLGELGLATEVLRPAPFSRKSAKKANVAGPACGATRLARTIRAALDSSAARTQQR